MSTKKRGRPAKGRPAKRPEVKLTRMDRFRGHIIGEIELTQDEIEILARYRRAHSMLALGYSELTVLQQLENEYGVGERQCRSYITNGSNLYGNLREIDEKAKRNIYEERFLAIATLARKRDDGQTQTRAMENAAKIAGVYNPISDKDDPKDWEKPTNINFSTDVAVLQAQQTQDTEYEEVEDE